jgi:periplasmic copper chaperone A
MKWQVGQPADTAPKGPDTLLPVSALRAGLVALSAVFLTAACAAGQQAQTSNERPSLDGTQGSVGAIQLEDVALHAPTGTSYSAGDSVPMSVYINNNAESADTLTGVTSSAFTGWDVVSTPSVQVSAAPGAAAATGSPQQIGAGAAVGLGLENLTAEGTGSAETLVLTGLAKKDAPLTPGMAVKITFTFAKAGQTTLTVPVQLSSNPKHQTLRPSYVAPSD